MPAQGCPNCKKVIDIDGFVENPDTLYICECGKIYDMPEFFHLEEVPKDEVDLSGLEGQFPIPGPRRISEYGSNGLHIRKDRWKPKATA